MTRPISLLLLLVIIVGACSPEQESAETSPPPTPELAREDSEAQESEVEGIVATPTGEVTIETATETPIEPTDTPGIDAAEETTIGPTATIASTVEEEVIFNGSYKNTYFRGSTAAPVTLIDYSDFL